MTTRAPTTRRSPRRRLGARLVSLCASPAGGGANNSGSRSVVATIQGQSRLQACAAPVFAGRDSSAWPGDTGNHFYARSNPTIARWGFKRLLRASYFNAATQTGLARAPSLYPVIGVAAPITTSRSYAGHRGMNTGHERDSYSVVTPALRAPDFRPEDAGGLFFGFYALVRHSAFFCAKSVGQRTSMITTDVVQRPLPLPAHPVAVDLDEIRRQPTGHETETERENRLLREENIALRRVLMAGVR